MPAPVLLRSGNFNGRFGKYSGADFAVLGTHLYFTAGAESSGGELWKSDGTSAGTTRIADFSGDLYGGLRSLSVAGSSLFFVADDGSSGLELWKSDGTSAGTVLVKDILPGGSSSLPGDLTAVGDTFFFSARDGGRDFELWKSDGTEAGTVRVADIRPGAAGSDPSFLTAVGNTLFFLADDGTGTVLWKSDGTSAGTARVADIYPDTSYADEFTAVGNSLFFLHDDGSSGYELWKSDGTNAGTSRVADINPGSSDSYPTYLTAVGDTLFFRANDGSRGRELWKSDGTASGTALVKDIIPGVQSGSYPRELTAAGNTLFFTAFGGSGFELWKSDGTAAGTVLVKDINPGFASSRISNITAVGSWIYFLADDGSSGKELWVSDGTTDSTKRVADINPGTGDSEFDDLVVAGTTLYLFRRDGEGGDLSELWALDASAAFASSSLSILTIAPLSSDKPEGDSSSTNFTFRVTRTGDLSAESTARWSVTGSGDNPATAADFANGRFPSGTVRFLAGQSARTITARVAGDTIFESDEQFTVSLSNPTGASIDPALSTAIGTIRNDDAPPPVVGFISSLNGEVQGLLDDSDALNPRRDGSYSEDYRLTDLIPGVPVVVALDADFDAYLQIVDAVTQEVVEFNDDFGDGLNSRLEFTPQQDVDYLARVTSFGDREIGAFSLRAFVAQPVLSIAALSADKPEGDSNSTPFTFRVTRSGDLTGESRARWKVTGTGANPANAADFAKGRFPSGPIRFLSGQSTRTITIRVAGDTIFEPDEQFTISLSQPAGASIDPAFATANGTIRNDDAPPLPELAIARGSAVKAEGSAGNTPFTFTVTRTGDSSQASSATWAVTGAGANPADAADFARGVFPKGTVRFAAGATTSTITVNVRGDRVQELDESFAVTLANPSGATIRTARATGIIRNDDLIGTSAADTIVGTSRPEFIDGLAGQDTLTGGAGPDVFGFRFGQSRIRTPDRITDFRFGEDKITLLNGRGQLLAAPVAFSRAANNSTATSLAALADAVFADANGRAAGNQPLAANAAALVRSTNAAIAGTYLLINNGTAGRSFTGDLMVNITGYSGTLPALGVRPVELVFG